MSYQSADIVKSQHSLFVEEAHHGKYIGLISNRLPVKNSALANSIFRQLLHEDIYKKDVEPDELLTRCNSELTKIRPVAAGKTLNSTDFSVALLYHKTHTNELVISGQNQHIFIFQQPNNETGSNENHYQVISLREIAKLTYQSPGIIYLFSTNILEKIEHSDVISFLNINLVNPTRTIFQDKIKEYYKQFDDFIVAHFKY